MPLMKKLITQLSKTHSGFCKKIHAHSKVVFHPLWIGLGLFLAASAQASSLWTGPNITFSKVNFADPTLAAHQDRLTNSVWLTRGDFQGIFNLETSVGRPKAV
ncbi:MAG: hypothetical protein RL497_2425 [Pseudomonadota bacterium]|jgi:hypothetical protein